MMAKQTKSIYQLVFDSPQEPAAAAIVYPGFEIKWAKFRYLVSSFSRQFQLAGVKPGMLCAIDDWDPLTVLVTALALAPLGTKWILAGASLPTQSDECRINFVIGRFRRASEAQLPFIEVQRSWMAQSTMASLPGPPDQPQNDQDVCMIASSSGTTGNTKWMSFSHRSLLSKIDRHRTKWPIAPRVKMGMPPRSMWGFTEALAILSLGGTVFYGPSPSSSMIGLHHIDSIVGSPNQFEGMLGDLENNKFAVKSLKRFVVGGAVLPTSMLTRMMQIVPDIIQMYGSSELGPTAFGPATVKHLENGEIGNILPGILAAVSDDNDNALPNGHVGQLKFRSEDMVSSYLADDRSTSMAFKNGWFYPGDIGSISEDQVLSVLGRSADLLNIGGVKFDAAHLDNIVRDNPSITDGAVFTLSNENGLELVCAAVVLPGKLTADLISSIINRCRRERGYRAMNFVTQVDEIPRTSTGKVQRQQLRQKVLDMGLGLAHLQEIAEQSDSV